jgi:chromosome segregation ATPase
MASSGNKNNRYRQTIDNIRSETKKLKELMGPDQVGSLSGSESQIARLQDQGDTYVRRIELEKKRVAELDRKIADVQEKIQQQRTAMGGIQGAKETNESINRKIKGMENKLDKALQKYNEVVAQNKQIRDGIDTLRREKLVYTNIYKKLQTELEEKREKLNDLLAKGEMAVREREAAKKRMEELRKKAENEQEEFKRDWQELTNIIEKDKRIKEFVQKEGAEKKRREELGETEDGTETENDLLKRVAKSAWGVVRDKASIKHSVKKVEQYEEAFKKIYEATGITEIEELVKTFVEAEKHNYSLFNYVNELTNDMEKLEQEISEIKADIERFKGQGLNTDSLRRKKMEDLEGKIQSTELRAEDYERKYEKTMKTINALKAGVQSIFDKIGCTVDNAQDVLGGQGVNEGNMMQYLGVIEQRTNEILQMYAACQAGSATEPAALNPNPQKKQKSNPKIEIEAPQLGEKETIEEDEQNQPLTKEEMRERAMKKILVKKK